MQCQCASRHSHPLARSHRPARGRPRARARLPQCAFHGRDHLHPRHHREPQSRRLFVCRSLLARRRRGDSHRHGAPFRHCALAVGARSPRFHPPCGADGRRRPPGSRGLRRAAQRAHPLGVLLPREQRVGHGQSRARNGAHGTRCRRLFPGRWGTERAALPGRRARVGLRFPRLQRAQTLRPDGRGRALRQRGTARADAAVSRRRGDDCPRHVRENYLRTPAFQVRSRHSRLCWHARLGCRDRLCGRHRLGSHCCLRRSAHTSRHGTHA